MKRDGGRCAARVAAICAAILCVALLATGVSHAENKVPLKIGARSTSAGPKAMIERYPKTLQVAAVNDLFDVETNAVTFVSAGGEEALPLQSKADVARAIVDRIVTLLAPVVM